MSIIVKKVTTRTDISEFINLPFRLYKGNACYVPDLNSDIKALFSPKTNPSLQFCKMQGFLAEKDGITAGRIIGIINDKANAKWHSRVVRFGWIEFEDDEAVSAALLNAVAQWGKAYGMEEMQGPLGFTDFDKEGMLIEDFDKMGSMISIYNLPYYPAHMERLGFEKAADWLHVRVRVPEKLPERYAKSAKLCREIYGLKTRRISRREIIKDGYGFKAFDLFNETYSQLFGFCEFTNEQVENYIKEYVSLVDTRMLPVVEDSEGNMIGMAITMCSLSNALRKSRGRILPFGWLYLLKALKFKREDTADLMLIAVKKEYQGLGVNALMFESLVPVYNKLGIKYAETGPQLETNVKELSQWKPMNPELIKRRRCYTIPLARLTGQAE